MILLLRVRRGGERVFESRLFEQLILEKLLPLIAKKLPGSLGKMALANVRPRLRFYVMFFFLLQERFETECARTRATRWTRVLESSRGHTRSRECVGTLDTPHESETGKRPVRSYRRDTRI